MAIFL